jgi:hypothetical protein
MALYIIDERSKYYLDNLNYLSLRRKLMYLKKIPVLLLMFAFLFVVSCGSNLFEGMIDNSGDINVEDLLKNASSKEDYEKAEEILLDRYEEATNTENQKEIAYNLGKAKVGKTGANNMTLISKISDISKEDSEGSQKSIFNSVENYVQDNDLSDDTSLKETSEAIDLMVYSIGGDKPSNDNKVKTQTQVNALVAKIEDIDVENDSEKKSQLITLGNTCATQLISIVSNKLSIDEDGDAEYKDSEETGAEILEYFMEPKTDDESNLDYNVFGLAKISQTAYEKSGVFKEDQIEQTSKLDTAGNQMNDLWAVYQGESGDKSAFKLPKYNSEGEKTGATYDKVYNLNNDADIKQAQTDIFKNLK